MKTWYDLYYNSYNENRDEEISYFKVDVNLIPNLPDAYLGNVWKFYDINHWWQRVDPKKDENESLNKKQIGEKSSRREFKLLSKGRQPDFVTYFQSYLRHFFTLKILSQRNSYPWLERTQSLLK